MTNRQKRRDLRDALHTLSLYKSYTINGTIFNRVSNGIVITHPDSWLSFSWEPNYMVDIMYSPRRAIKILWRLMNRPEYIRHDLFWEKMYNYQHQHKTERGTCKVCGRETNSISSALDINYCANCWNKELKGKSNIKEGTSVFMSTLTDTSHIRETLLKQYENKVNWRDLPSPPEDSRERVPGK